MIVETIKEVPIEYIVKRNNPVPKTRKSIIEVPHYCTQEDEEIIKKEIICEIVTEEPVKIEKEVEVIVERKIERPVYKEYIEEREVYIDQVIEEEYEVLVPNIIKREIEREYKIPIVTHTQRPRENMDHYETDVNIQTRV